MASSFLKVLDLAVETLVFNKFKDLLFVQTLGVSGYSGYSGSLINDISFMPKEVAFRHISEKRGKVELEFMNLWRSGIAFPWERNRSVLAIRDLEIPTSDSISGYSGYSGASGYSGYSGLIGSLRTVPAKLSYDFWVWSKDKDKLNAVSERYMFWKFRDPNLNLSLNGEIPLEFDLHFGDITDESTETSMFEKGLYFVHKFPLLLDGWIFELAMTKIIETIYIKGYDNTVNPLGQLLWSTTITSLDEKDDIWA